MKSTGERLRDNWNRMSELSRVMNKTESEKEEFKDRIRIQNHFSNTGEIIKLNEARYLSRNNNQ